MLGLKVCATTTGPILVSYREGLRDTDSIGSVSGVNLAQVLICGYSIYSNRDIYIFHLKHYDPCDLTQYQEDSRKEAAVLYHPWGDEPIPKPGSLCWGTFKEAFHSGLG